MGTTTANRDKFGDLPDDWCCRGECCGPGSWCCQRSGLHYHEDVEPPQWVGRPQPSLPASEWVSAEIHVVLGMEQDEWDAVMAAGRLTDGWTGVEVSNDPHWHSHPLLGITGHLHQGGRQPHAHRPKWEWDMDRPVFLSASDAA